MRNDLLFKTKKCFRPDNYDEGWYQDETTGEWYNQFDWLQDEATGEWYYEDRYNIEKNNSSL